MLILTRKQGEAFLLDDNIEITLLEVSGDKVKIAIDAPKQVKILRKELAEARELNREALLTEHPDLTALKNIMKEKHNK